MKLIKKGLKGLFVIIIFLSLTGIGSSWTVSKRITWNSGTSSPNDMARDLSNNLYIVWTDNTSGNTEVYFKKSTDNGVTWIMHKRLTYTPVPSGPVTIGVDSSNIIHIIWVDGYNDIWDLYYKNSTDGGSTWSSRVRLTWGQTGKAYTPSMVVDKNDNIHVVWTITLHATTNSEIFYKNSTDGGINWSPLNRLTYMAENSKEPVIATDLPKGTPYVHVIWSDRGTGNYEIYHKRSTDLGSSWSAPNRLTWTIGVSNYPAVAVAYDQGVHIVWMDSSSGNFDIYHKRSGDRGVTWSSAKRLTWNTGSSMYPKVSPGLTQTVYVVWDDQPASASFGNHEIYFKQSTDSGINWGASVRLTYTSGESYYPVAEKGSAGNLHLLWARGSAPAYEVYYKRKD